MSERCALIEAEKANFPILFMCVLLGVARSTFYDWRMRVESPTAARRRVLAEKIQKVFDDSRQTSGCRRVAAQLNREGIECSVGLVADLMRELGLRAVQPRAYKVTTVPGQEPVEAPDLIGPDFDPASAVPGAPLVMEWGLTVCGPWIPWVGASTAERDVAAVSGTSGLVGAC